MNKFAKPEEDLSSGTLLRVRLTFQKCLLPSLSGLDSTRSKASLKHGEFLPPQQTVIFILQETEVSHLQPSCMLCEISGSHGGEY
jgi:hypothetical protein